MGGIASGENHWQRTGGLTDAGMRNVSRTPDFYHAQPWDIPKPGSVSGWLIGTIEVVWGVYSI